MKIHKMAGVSQPDRYPAGALPRSILRDISGWRIESSLQAFYFIFGYRILNCFYYFICKILEVPMRHGTITKIKYTTQLGNNQLVFFAPFFSSTLVVSTSVANRRAEHSCLPGSR